MPAAADADVASADLAGDGRTAAGEAPVAAGPQGATRPGWRRSSPGPHSPGEAAGRARFAGAPAGLTGGGPAGSAGGGPAGFSGGGPAGLAGGGPAEFADASVLTGPGGSAAFGGLERTPGGCPLGRPGTAVVGCFTVPSRPQSVALARGFVARLLADEPDAGTTVLLASELVANSVMHAYSGRRGAAVSLAVLAVRGGLRIEVADHGGPTIPLIREPSEFLPGGRGLRLVDALAARWGFYRTEAGTVTWFEIPACAAG